MSSSPASGVRDLISSVNYSSFAGFQLGKSSFTNLCLFFETQDENWVFNTGTKPIQKLDFEQSGFDTKGKYGFDTRGFDIRIDSKPNENKDFKTSLVNKREGSLIISSISPPPLDRKTKPRSVKKPKNRKRVVFDSHFEHNGKYYEVMTRSSTGKTKYGIYYEIMDRIIEQFEIAYKIHGRIFVQHLVLSTAHFTADNKEMTGFRKSLVQMVKRKYGANQIAFVWAREMEKVKKQHYHLFIAIDGAKVWFKDTLGKVIKKIVKRSNYFTSFNLAGFHQVNDESSFRELIFHASYIAKERGKGRRGVQAKDFGSSRLKHKVTI